MTLFLGHLPTYSGLFCRIQTRLHIRYFPKLVFRRASAHIPTVFFITLISLLKESLIDSIFCLEASTMKLGTGISLCKGAFPRIGTSIVPAGRLVSASCGMTNTLPHVEHFVTCPRNESSSTIDSPHFGQLYSNCATRLLLSLPPLFINGVRRTEAKIERRTLEILVSSKAPLRTYV